MLQNLLITIACLSAGLLCACSAHGGEDPPPVFDKRPYASAKSAANEAKKWFIVKATAEWCGPCKQMDRTTWRDEQVVEWVEQHAILVALDVDQHKDLAAELGIQAMPTMIAFKEGNEEFDRIVGYRSPDAMLAWLEGIDRGERSIEAIRERAVAPPGERVDVQAKMDLAQSLMQGRQYEEAADEYVWLWEHMLQHSPSMYGVRLSFMASDMERLARMSAEARDKFVQLRDKAGARLDAEKVDAQDLVDWVVLNNRVLNDFDSTVEWFDRVKDQPRWQPLIQRVSRDLSKMFIQMNRWADAGRLYTDPLGELQSSYDLMTMTSRYAPPEGLTKEQRQELEEMPARMFRDGAGELYAGLLAAGREEAAASVAAKAREYDPSAETVSTLIETALQADQPRAVHQQWIAALQDASLDDLAARVAEAMKKDG